MRFVQFVTKAGRTSVGVEKTLGGDLVDLCAGDTSLPSRMIDFLRAGPAALASARRVVQSGNHEIPRSEVTFQAPVSHPDKVLCVGLNYMDHCQELGVPPPKIPVVFNKFPSTIIGPRDDLTYPLHATIQKLDWEVELALVIGKETKNVEPRDVMNHVFGYTVALDVSARDMLTPDVNGGQWLLGKSMDTFCPLGPAIVTPDDLDPNNLNITCSVNGVNKQTGNTNLLIHNTEQLVSYISRYISLLPGDVILTGTPPGVGVARKPAEFLKRGDIVECEIEGIGKLVNKIV